MKRGVAQARKTEVGQRADTASRNAAPAVLDAFPVGPVATARQHQPPSAIKIAGGPLGTDRRRLIGMITAHMPAANDSGTAITRIKIRPTNASNNSIANPTIASRAY